MSQNHPTDVAVSPSLSLVNIFVFLPGTKMSTSAELPLDLLCDLKGLTLQKFTNCVKC